MISDIRQVIHFYIGQWVVIDSLPDNPNYQHWQKIEGYKLGEKYKIRGVGETSCWLERGSGTFPVPHQHLKLCLRFISGIDGASPEKIMEYLKQGLDVFNIIGKFAVIRHNEQKSI